ncbi:FHA domain-containing protein [Cryobacterium arcticum]|uniref:FHA domain-containing protein n=1 Tax=Cryobacterium arcticum TaxID=670052 RepID=UPI000831086A|nr:FHA domain-containing protein [Cryobacterium arcticum]
MLSYDDDNSGGWLAAATGDRVVLLPADVPAALRIWAGLTAEVSADAGARTVLDELTSGGLSRTPPFALLSWEKTMPATVRVFVRGDVVVVLQTPDGDVSIGGLGISTWVERSVAHVTGASVTASPLTETGSDPDADDQAPLSIDAGLPLVAGLVRTRRLRLAVDAVAAAGAASAPVPPPARIVPPPAVLGAAPTSPVGPTESAAPAVAPVTAPAPLPVPQEDIAEPASEQTITDIVPADSGAADAVPTDAVPAPGRPGGAPDSDAAADLGGYDHLFGATVMRGVEQAAVRPDSEADDDAHPAAEPAAAPSAAQPDAQEELAGDHDGHTVMSGDLQKLRASRRRPEAAPAAAEAPRLYLLLPSGVREPLSQPIRIGRAPSVSQMSGGLVPRLVSLGGADQDVSRNHVHFTVEGDTVVVTDLHSRNGTLVALPGKPPQKLRQGEPTAVIVGTVVDLGSGITITVGQE